MLPRTFRLPKGSGKFFFFFKNRPLSRYTRPVNIRGNRGTSATTPFVLTPSGSCQILGQVLNYYTNCSKLPEVFQHLLSLLSLSLSLSLYLYLSLSLSSCPSPSLPLSLSLSLRLLNSGAARLSASTYLTQSCRRKQANKTIDTTSP